MKVVKPTKNKSIRLGKIFLSQVYLKESAKQLKNK